MRVFDVTARVCVCVTVRGRVEEEEEEERTEGKLVFVVFQR